jgi:RNA polymerase sigma-70 factor, ECF subfamily
MADSEYQAEEERDYQQFIELFSRHQRHIKAYIRALVPSTADAEDIMQETSVVLWRKFSAFDSQNHFGRWGCGIARLLVLELRRKAAKDKHWFGEELLDVLSSEHLGKEDLYYEVRREALDQCVASLDPAKRTYLELRYGKNMSVDDVSRSMNRPTSTLYRIFANLRKALYDCVSRKLSEASRT